MAFVSLSRYVREALTMAEYRKGSDFDCVVVFVLALPGCLTQGANLEEARSNLIDAIEVWVTAGLRAGEAPPPLNGCVLGVAAREPELVEAAACA